MFLLASFVDTIQNVIFKLEGFFGGFQLIYAFEWLFFFLLIYYVSKVLRENEATKLMLVYWGLLVCGGVMYCAKPELFTKGFFLMYTLVASALMVMTERSAPPLPQAKMTKAFLPDGCPV